MQITKKSIVKIPVSVLHKALKQTLGENSEKQEIIKEHTIEYYNTKLLYLLRYERWPEFFYVYETASLLNHGVNNTSHIIAAHAYVMAFNNPAKALLTLDKISDSPAKKLATNIFDNYLELKKLGIEPASPDWSVLVNMNAVVANGKPSLDKWAKVNRSSKTAWHLALRPWKYPRSMIEMREDFRYKQRKDK